MPKVNLKTGRQPLAKLKMVLLVLTARPMFPLLKKGLMVLPISSSTQPKKMARLIKTNNRSQPVKLKTGLKVKKATQASKALKVKRVKLVRPVPKVRRVKMVSTASPTFQLLNAMRPANKRPSNSTQLIPMAQPTRPKNLSLKVS